MLHCFMQETGMIVYREHNEHSNTQQKCLRDLSDAQDLL